MNPVTLQRATILCPRESWNRVALDRGGDPQLLTLVNGDVTHRPGEGRGRPVDALLGPGLDGHGSVGPKVFLQNTLLQTLNTWDTK